MKRDPFNWLYEVGNQFDAAMSEAFGGREPRRAGYRFVTEDGVNVIQVDVPGCGPEDVEAVVRGRLLDVAWKAGSREGSLSFKIPSSADPAKVSASVRHGVLSVRLPGREGEREAERRVPVSG